ncbi:GNAT family N-acetyltransferase [Hymenobacter bucti]|uniref:GNAT family N-acetyltransferase n=1 Tax=Hymenobacter bucti TaxID=1844114 RepID=A0ABW4QTS6_9BACT
MHEFLIREASVADAPALADLANQYTYQNLDETARQGGFLTGSFAAPALGAMLASVPGQVAYYQEELAGFVINSKLPTERYPPFIQAISALLPSLLYQQRPLTDYRWFYYGPVLVRQEYRGQGLLQQLFAATKQRLAGRFDLGVAFIAAENAASRWVHVQKLGLEPVGELNFQGQAYDILMFPVT